MKKNKTSKNWIRKQYKDFYVRESKAKGFRSRSAFKLMEINKKFNFINNSTILLDLGSSPGGWSQVAGKIIKKGKILAIDIKDMEKIDKVEFINADIDNEETLKKIQSYFNKEFDVVISDIAANTTGNKNLDSYKTGELCIKSMNLAKSILQENGVFLSKLFMGSIYKEIYEKAKKYFKLVRTYKPESSRKESKEIYIYCKGVYKTFKN